MGSFEFVMHSRRNVVDFSLFGTAKGEGRNDHEGKTQNEKGEFWEPDVVRLPIQSRKVPERSEAFPYGGLNII
jgi:hypothetical protein